MRRIRTVRLSVAQQPREKFMSLASQHISFERLADLAERRLTPEESQMSQQHIAACDACGREWASLSNVIAAMRADTSEDAPRDLVFSVVSMFRAARPEKPSLARRVLAALSFDSAQRTPAYGLRSGATAAARQMLFNAEGYDLDLRVATKNGQIAVSGQVLGDDCAGSVALENETVSVQTALNDLCEFTLPPVPSGVYTLRLRLSGLEVEIPNLELNA
jgi:hypothetical protein